MAKLAVFDAVIQLRRELGDDAFDGTEETIANIPDGTAEDSVRNLVESKTLAETMAVVVGVDFETVLKRELGEYVSEQETSQENI